MKTQSAFRSHGYWLAGHKPRLPLPLTQYVGVGTPNSQGGTNVCLISLCVRRERLIALKITETKLIYEFSKKNTYAISNKQIIVELHFTNLYVKFNIYFLWVLN